MQFFLLFVLGRSLSIFTELLARLEIVVGTVIVEETIIVSSLPILKTLEQNLTWLLLFRLVDTLTRVANVAGID